LEDAALVGGGHEQQRLRDVWKLGHPSREGALQLRGERQALRERSSSLEQVRAERARQLEERERVPRRRGEEPTPNGRCEVRSVQIEQRARGALVERFEVQLREPGGLERVVRVVSDLEQEDDRLRFETPGDECQHVTAGAVEPLRVLDDERERRAGRRLTEQLQRCKCDQEHVRGSHVGHPEGRGHCRTLRARAARRSRLDTVVRADADRRTAGELPIARRRSSGLGLPVLSRGGSPH
jgi:hypothetical protein